MASTKSIDTHATRVKEHLLSVVKPWLDGYMASGGRGRQDPHSDIEVAFETLQLLTTLAPTIMPKHDSENHAVDTRAKRLLHAVTTSIGSIRQSLEEVTKASRVKHTEVVGDPAAQNLFRSIALASTCQLAYMYVYDVYRQIKESKELCDLLFDQDREFFKAL